MLNYIVKRIILAFFTTAAISVLSFVVIQLPKGDYVDWYVEDLMQKGDHISLAQAQNIREYYGLDKPMVLQYGMWMWRMTSLDFGYGFEGQKPVEEQIAEKLPTSNMGNTTRNMALCRASPVIAASTATEAGPP